MKGNMFFLSLPLNDTLDKLNALVNNISHDHLVDLPDPELYIIVDGQPTKDKIVWQTLVDVDKIKWAVQKLKETNFLYADIDGASVDSSVSKAIEVVSDVHSAALQKCTKDDVAGLQAYTIRRIN